MIEVHLNTNLDKKVEHIENLGRRITITIIETIRRPNNLRQRSSSGNKNQTRFT